MFLAPSPISLVKRRTNVGIPPRRSSGAPPRGCFGIHERIAFQFASRRSLSLSLLTHAELRGLVLMAPTLMPHAVCWQQDQPLIWTMAIANAITFLSYFPVCATLFYFAGKTRGAVKRHWAFFLIGFGLFIVACGTTHLMEVVTTWVPLFWIDAAVNVLTAA